MNNDEEENEDAEPAGGNLAQHGKVSYIEIPASDLEQSAAFYEGVFGWNIDRRENGDRTFSDGANDLIGRWLLDRPVPLRPGILLYIYVDGIRAVLARLEAAGGTVVEPLRPEGDLLLARFRDPAGNVMGVWEFAGE